MEAETSRLSDFIGGPEKSGNSSFRVPFGECRGPFKGPIPTLPHGNRQEMAFGVCISGGLEVPQAYNSTTRFTENDQKRDKLPCTLEPLKWTSGHQSHHQDHPDHLRDIQEHLQDHFEGHFEAI